MAEENDNNRSNYEEVEAHCKLLSAKLGQLTQHQPATGSAIDDLEAYYERAIQLRVMRIATLEEQHREMKLQSREFKRQLAQAGTAAALLLFCYIIALHPHDTLDLVVRYWSYAAVALLGTLTRLL